MADYWIHWPQIFRSITAAPRNSRLLCNGQGILLGWCRLLYRANFHHRVFLIKNKPTTDFVKRLFEARYKRGLSRVYHRV